MRFIQHYSSSEANLYEVVADNGHRLLLECGLPWAKVEKALNYDLSNIDACLLTHEHKDHSKAVKEIMKAGITVYASEGTLRAIEDSLHLARQAKTLPPYTGFTNTHFDCYAFPIIHDAVEPFGYLIREMNTNEYLLFCPDSGFIKQRFAMAFTIIALECSYDSKVLRSRVKAGDIHKEVAKRIIQNHAEKDTTLKYLRDFCDLSKCREIHLLHMSRGNIDAEKTRKEFEDMFFADVVITAAKQ